MLTNSVECKSVRAVRARPTAFKDILKGGSNCSGATRVEITALLPSDFNGRQLKKTGTVAVLFTTEWCPFCQRFKPLFESALDQNGMTKTFVDLSDLENPLWEVFDVGVVPTVVVFKDGDPVLRKDGVLGRGLPADVMIEVVRKIEATRVVRS